MIGEIIYIGRGKFGRIVSENLAMSTIENVIEFQFMVVRVEPATDAREPM